LKFEKLLSKTLKGSLLATGLTALKSPSRKMKFVARF